MPTPDIPTLARLSFRVPPGRMAEFEAAYQENLVPILKRHGLMESPEPGRTTPDTTFSRLFEVRSPSEVAERREALQNDLACQETLRGLGAAFGTVRSDGLMQHSMELYATPAGPGEKMSAGRGTGHWHTYNVTDGLAQVIVQAILQDREGVLWFGTRGGVSRYDGHTFTSFSSRDGLANNWIWSMLQDRDGHLWFSTNRGVSRYDGHTFTSFTSQDGLANGDVYAICQDREGSLWFGTRGGVSRYDDHTFTSFSSRDGLANNDVCTIYQDWEGCLWFGTWGGVSRYDDHTFTSFSSRDGLANNNVQSICQDREGNLWFGTRDSGVSRYDGEFFTTLSSRDGLVHD